MGAIHRVLGTSVLACLLATGAATASELWVVQQGAGDVDVIDPTLLSVLATIDISDPDGNSFPDIPYDLCMSTIPGRPPTTRSSHRARSSPCSRCPAGPSCTR